MNVTTDYTNISVSRKFSRAGNKTAFNDQLNLQNLIGNLCYGSTERIASHAPVAPVVAASAEDLSAPEIVVVAVVELASAFVAVAASVVVVDLRKS